MVGNVWRHFLVGVELGEYLHLVGFPAGMLKHWNNMQDNSLPFPFLPPTPVKNYAFPGPLRAATPGDIFVSYTQGHSQTTANTSPHSCLKPAFWVQVFWLSVWRQPTLSKQYNTIQEGHHSQRRYRWLLKSIITLAWEWGRVNLHWSGKDQPNIVMG